MSLAAYLEESKLSREKQQLIRYAYGRFGHASGYNLTQFFLKRAPFKESFEGEVQALQNRAAESGFTITLESM